MRDPIEVRSVPVRLEPAPGEALTGWMHALAARLSIGYGSLRAAAGVAVRPNVPHSDLLGYLTPVEADRLARFGGLSPEQLHAMTLSVWNGTFVDLRDDGVRRYTPLPLWTPNRGMRACAACLASSNGQRWFLRWYLPWSFACVAHHQLLLLRCPRCGRPLDRRIAAFTSINAVGVCPHPSPDRASRQRCGYVLADAEPPALDDNAAAVMAAQRWIDDVMDRAAANPDLTLGGQPVRESLVEITVLARRLLMTGITGASPVAVGRAGEDLRATAERMKDKHHWADIGSHPVWQAAATAHAVAVWRDPDRQHRDAVLRDLLERDRARRVLGPSQIAASWADAPRLRDHVLGLHCPAPGLMEGLIQREDEGHGRTEEVPGGDPGAGDEDGG